MNEQNLVREWNNAWNRVIFAQLAPTALLITTVALLQFGLADAAFDVRVGAWLILLASGILGALAEYSAADDAQAVAADLLAVAPGSNTAKRIAGKAKWMSVVKFVTPAIFVAIFIALSLPLLLG